MDSTIHFLWSDLIWHHGKFLGVEWGTWKVVGWLGNVVFCARFVVQWYATEKRKQVVVPQAFWWLSLVGSLTLLCYSVHQHDSVFIYAYAFTWIPYMRNLMIHRKSRAALSQCVNCGQKNPPQANFCPNCGVKLSPAV